MLLAACTAVAIAEPDPVFDILEYQVSGNSVLPVLVIEQVVYPHLGERKTIQDVEAARAALEKAYHNDGYLTVFVDIPEQKVQDGTVYLRVREGKVARLRVSGARYYAPSRIKAGVPALAEGSVPYFPAVQEQLAALSTSADRRVTPVLRPGRTPGTVEVDLKVEDRLPVHASLEFNDRYFGNATRTRLNANLRYDNLWQRGHSIALGLQAAPENADESKVFSTTYVLPMARGDYLAVYGVNSQSNVAAVGGVNVIGKGTILGMRYIHVLQPEPGYFHTFTLGVDYKDFKETVNLVGADSVNTPISYLPLSLAYEGTLKGATNRTQLGATINFSLRGVADNQVECLPGIFLNEFACKRYLAEANYVTLRLDIKHTKSLPGEWSLYGRFSGQLVSGPLISNEQFGAGGVDSVRGYTETSALGDGGGVAGLELRTPPLARRVSERLDELTLYAFTEGARLRLKNPLPGQIDRFDLLSAGLGLRFRGWGRLSGALDLAYPFEPVGQVQAGDGRVHFRLGYEW